MSEETRVQDLAGWYSSEQLDFDRRLIEFRHRAIRPFLHGRNGLELGPADGEMTKFLKDDFETLTIVEGAEKLLRIIPEYPNVVKVNSIFERFKPTTQFDTILLEHILEHVEDPQGLLATVQPWLAKNGRLIIGVPNGHSFHRLVAVKMNMLPDPCALNERDEALGHRRVYSPQTLRSELERAGLRISQMGGVYFKPVSNKQIEEQWNEEMIEGFYLLGQDFPENAAELFAICTIG